MLRFLILALCVLSLSSARAASTPCPNGAPVCNGGGVEVNLGKIDLLAPWFGSETIYTDNGNGALTLMSTNVNGIDLNFEDAQVGGNGVTPNPALIFNCHHSGGTTTLICRFSTSAPVYTLDANAKTMAFSVLPTIPTAALGDVSQDAANAAWVSTYFASKASPAFSGTPTAPTIGAGDVSQDLANAAWVSTYFATKASPAFTGAPTAPTPAGSDNSTTLATTAFVKGAVAATSGPPNTAGEIDIGTGTASSWNQAAFATGNATLTISFATAPDLIVTYTAQSAPWTRVGDLVCISGTVSFSPSYSTSSGNFQIRGLPFTVSAAGPNWPLQISNPITSFSWPNSGTVLNISAQAGGTYALLQGYKSGGGTASASTTQFPSGTAQSISFGGCYKASSTT